LLHCVCDSLNRGPAHRGASRKQDEREAEPAAIAATDHKSRQRAQAQRFERISFDGFFGSKELSRQRVDL
jgi:hypothetical protein